MKAKVILSWSGGKDSALALHELYESQNYEIAALLTTVTQDYDRISMHGVRRVLLERQARSLGLPLEKVFISKDTSNEEYESKIREVLVKYLTAGVRCAAFGDIFLEDLRKHREDNLSKIGMEGIFPIWKRDTAELAHKQMLSTKYLSVRPLMSNFCLSFLPPLTLAVKMENSTRLYMTGRGSKKGYYTRWERWFCEKTVSTIVI
jgi:diphthamide synthase (EF-2-diphthine--ammonia ligase)